jgi:peroxiredoxin
MAAFRIRKLLSAGSRAPDFRLQRLEGGEASLQDLISAGPALLVFFKVTCPTCQFALPIIDRIHSPGRLAVYTISQNDAEDTRDFNRRYGMTVPTLLDPEDDYPTSNAYGISTVPTAFLVETGGTVSQVLEGWNKREVESLGKLAGVVVIRQTDNLPEWKAG